jgi:hypothetical protein
MEHSGKNISKDCLPHPFPWMVNFCVQKNSRSIKIDIMYGLRMQLQRDVKVV